jgi:hypothetical protein
MNRYRLLRGTLIPLAFGIVSTCALSTEADAEDGALFELQVTGYAHGENGDALLSTQFYAEKPLPMRDVSAFMVVHHDREFRAIYAGLARKFGDFQFGLGFGNAWFDQLRQPAINPWLYYSDDTAETFLSAERYGGEDWAPWFYRGHAIWRTADSIFIGTYGEKDLGVGPMIQWRNSNFRIWAAVPVVSRPEAGARGVAGVQVEF